jgi:hypothetical protein
MHVHRNPHTLDWEVTFGGHTLTFARRADAIRFARNNA